MEINNNIESPELNPGEEIFWTIRPRGNQRTIKCVIEEVILPWNIPDEDRYRYLLKKHKVKKTREHYSYVISEGVEVDVAHRFHWPRLNELSREMPEKAPREADIAAVVGESSSVSGTLGDYPEETPGTKMARETRQDANDLSGEESKELLENAMRMIYGGGNPTTVGAVDSPPPQGDPVGSFVATSMNTVTKVVTGIVRDFVSLLIKEMPRDDVDLRSSYALLQEKYDSVVKTWNQQVADLERALDADHKRHLSTLAEKDAELQRLRQELALVRGYLELERSAHNGDGHSVEFLNSEISRLQQELAEAKSRTAYYQEKAKHKRKKEGESKPTDLVRFVVSKMESQWAGYDRSPREEVVEEYLEAFEESQKKAAHGN